ncbi:MAG: ATP-binding protein [Nitrospira sp.]|nr:ATP-binding protein [Nitrospira sp.]
MSEHSHPIDVDLEKILPILAKEIYTSPFAFLRENVQNAFDAVRIQAYRDSEEDIKREHRIVVHVDGNRVSITDSGIGMTADDLKNLFWSIGKSGKHTNEAKSAGVVGTFGIGGMANFGVCSRLEVTSRTYASPKAVHCWAEYSELSASQKCVFYKDGPLNTPPGTTVNGTLFQPITVEQVSQYLTPIVQFLNIPIEILNGQRLSGTPFPTVERSGGASVDVANGPANLRLFLRVLQNGQAQVEVEELKWNEQSTPIRAVFATTSGVISAYQHGFMLANVPVTTVFGLGGSIDCQLLRPTAGREAVTDESRNLVQHLLFAIEKGLAEYIATQPGLPEQFSSFYRYLCQYGRWDLGKSASIRAYGSTQRVPLESLKGTGAGQVFYATDGNDQAIMQAYRETGKKVAILSTDSYRRKVEINYLTQYCQAKQLEDQITCLRVIEDLPWNDLALKYRLNEKLRRQYLIENLRIRSGELTHGAMLWVPPKKSATELILFFDFRHQNIQRLVGLRDSLSFDAVCDIFIRDYVLLHLENAYPELRKRDFDAMLRKLQSSVEYFEIDPMDVSRLNQLAAITNMSPETLAAVLGARRPGRPAPSSVKRSDIARVSDVVEQDSDKSADEIRNEFTLKLLEIETDEVKILDAKDANPVIGLSKYYFALTPDAHVLYRRIFLERNPSIDFSWGGYRAGYLFFSEGMSVVYYDIKFENLIDVEDIGLPRAGTLRVAYQPLISKNMVYLPVPEGFQKFMVPEEKTLRFTIEHQIMGINEST